MQVGFGDVGRERGGGESRTDFIQLDHKVLGAQFAQQRFGRFAVGAVGFGEDGCFSKNPISLSFPFSFFAGSAGSSCGQDRIG